ncbi:MAG: 8-amino-7-oxononanoate synthase [Gammaproteobacteria bacterium]|nr:8-amino-7-oxononanoate synthase [Gammaproteobacteria bacterium]
MDALTARLQEQVEQRRQAGLYRSRSTLESPQGAQVRVAGQTYLNFCSNDYLGLAAHPRVVARLQQAAQRYGVGSGASHLVCGHSAPHHELEEALAEFTGRDRALLYSSGYMANVGVLTTLLRRGDSVFEDRLNHASLLDGGLASGAKFARFTHNSAADLARRLARGTGLRLVAVDGVFSMDGDEAPLAELAATCAAHEACLMVDDAHGFGVLGERGAGSLEQAGLAADQAPVLMATLGKALGTAGAFVAGSDVLVEALIQASRNYIYTTALPPAVAAATLESLRLLQEESWRRDHLHTLIKRFREGARQLELPVMESRSAIQPLLVNDADKAMELSRALAGRGLLISAIRPPTVPANTSRLRITLTAAHSEQQIDTLLDHLADCWRR